MCLEELVGSTTPEQTRGIHRGAVVVEGLLLVRVEDGLDARLVLVRHDHSLAVQSVAEALARVRDAVELAHALLVRVQGVAPERVVRAREDVEHKLAVDVRSRLGLVRDGTRGNQRRRIANVQETELSVAKLLDSTLLRHFGVDVTDRIEHVEEVGDRHGVCHQLDLVRHGTEPEAIVHVTCVRRDLRLDVGVRLVVEHRRQKLLQQRAAVHVVKLLQKADLIVLRSRQVRRAVEGDPGELARNLRVLGLLAVGGRGRRVAGPAALPQGHVAKLVVVLAAGLVTALHCGVVPVAVVVVNVPALLRDNNAVVEEDVLDLPVVRVEEVLRVHVVGPNRSEVLLNVLTRPVLSLELVTGGAHHKAVPLLQRELDARDDTQQPVAVPPHTQILILVQDLHLHLRPGPHGHTQSHSILAEVALAVHTSVHRVADDTSKREDGACSLRGKEEPIRAHSLVEVKQGNSSRGRDRGRIVVDDCTPRSVIGGVLRERDARRVRVGRRCDHRRAGVRRANRPRLAAVGSDRLQNSRQLSVVRGVGNGHVGFNGSLEVRVRHVARDATPRGRRTTGHLLVLLRTPESVLILQNAGATPRRALKEMGSVPVVLRAVPHRQRLSTRLTEPARLVVAPQQNRITGHASRARVLPHNRTRRIVGGDDRAREGQANCEGTPHLCMFKKV
eukprot:Rhum_TRINITY_DN15531_c0_g1::Rhum_TRINITY_DN15531_c0_g1_i1::g.161244::m.161244